MINSYCPGLVPAWFVPVFFSAELSLLVPVLPLSFLCWLCSCFISVFQRQAGTVPFCPCLSMHVPVCPHLSLSVHFCPCLSQCVPVCPCVSLLVPVCFCLSLSVPVHPKNGRNQTLGCFRHRNERQIKYSCRAITPKIVARRFIPRPFQDKTKLNNCKYLCDKGSVVRPST